VLAPGGLGARLEGFDSADFDLIRAAAGPLHLSDWDPANAEEVQGHVALARRENVLLDSPGGLGPTGSDLGESRPGLLTKRLDVSNGRLPAGSATGGKKPKPSSNTSRARRLVVPACVQAAPGLLTLAKKAHHRATAHSALALECQSSVGQTLLVAVDDLALLATAHTVSNRLALETVGGGTF